MNVEFINPFLESISNVLITMAKLEITSGDIEIKDDDEPCGDVTGMITMKSSETEGTFAISFSKEVALDMASKMLAKPFDDIDSEVCDLIGEVTNMVTGGAKAILMEQGFNFDMARPTVSLGKEFLEHQSGCQVVMIPFACDSGDLFVEVCFDEATAS